VEVPVWPSLAVLGLELMLLFEMENTWAVQVRPLIGMERLFRFVHRLDWTQFRQHQLHPGQRLDDGLRHRAECGSLSTSVDFFISHITDGCRESHHQPALEASTSSSPICKRRF